MAMICHSEGLMLTGRWRSWSLMLMVIGVVGLVGCSSGGDTKVAPPTPSSAPAESGSQDVSAADVAAGLRKIDQAAKDTGQAGGKEKARAVSLDGQIEPIWKTIEDSVKAKDQDTYLALEESFAMLEEAAGKGDAANAAKGSAAITTAVETYLAKNSG